MKTLKRYKLDLTKERFACLDRAKELTDEADALYENKQYSDSILTNLEAKKYLGGANALKQAIDNANYVLDVWAHLHHYITPETMAAICSDMFDYQSQNEPDSITNTVLNGMLLDILPHKYSANQVSRFFESDPELLNWADSQELTGG